MGKAILAMLYWTTYIILCQNKTIIGSSDFPKGLHFSKKINEYFHKIINRDQIYFDAAHYLSFYGIGEAENNDDTLMDGFSNLKAQSVLSELLEAYKNELQKSIQLISSIDEDKQQEIINKVYISGPGSHIKNWKLILRKYLNAA